MDTAEATFLNAKSSLISAQAGVAQAKSTLDQSKIDLGYCIIRSPVDGVVITRKVNIGQTLQSGFNVPVLFQVATDLTKMKVECDVDESDIGRVKEGQKVRFTVEAYPNDSFLGVVQQVRVSPTTTQNVVTYTTIVNVDNPEKKLLPGMTATVSIIVGEAKNVLRVPNAALRFTPTLSEAEMAKIRQEMMDRFQAQRQAQGGQPGGAPQAGATGAPAGQAQGAPAGQPAQGGQTFNRQGGGQGGGQGRAQMPRVWVQDPDGKLRMAMLRTGVSDTNYTEIVRSELKEGDVVLLGTMTAGSTTQSGPGMGGMMFMGGPPPGGRR
jgi:HlyD family secretion protein